MSNLISWMVRHPNDYAKQLTELKSTSLLENVEIVDKISGQDCLIAFADLIVRTCGGSKTYHIVIVYGENYPYESPSFYLLTKKPTCDEINNFSKHENLTKGIGDFFPVKRTDERHQMADGRLCLFENDPNLPNKVRADSLHDLIIRAREWLEGLLTGHFPPDSIGAELEPHFRRSDVHILLPEGFYSQDIYGPGNFYAFIQPTPFPGEQFIGTLIQGRKNPGDNILYFIDCRGQTEPVFPLIKHHAFTFDKIANEERTIIEDRVKKGILIEGIWFDLKKEPVPFKTIERCLETVCLKGDLDFQDKLLDQLRGVLTNPGPIYIGLRYEAREQKKIFEWLVLEIQLQCNDNERKTALVDKKERLTILLRSEIKACYIHEFREKTFFLRNQGMVLDDLSQKKIVLAGVGSLGSTIGNLLAKSGVGEFVLIDPDYMKPGNAIRHEEGVDWFGKYKLLTVAHNMQTHNPFVTITDYHANVYHITPLNREKLFENVDLVISTIAEEGPESYLNEMIMPLKIPIIFAWAERNAQLGRILVTFQGVTACKNCKDQYESDAFHNKPLPEGWIKIPYADQELMQRECTHPVIAGSAINLQQIANLGTRIALDVLSEKETANSSQWIFLEKPINEAEDERLHEGMKFINTFLPPHPLCQACNSRPIEKIILPSEVDDFIRQETSNSPDKETGGILIGIKQGNVVHVLQATEPGPKAERTAIVFDRDAEYAQSKLNEARESFGGNVDYVGEWHSHLEVNPIPSQQDLSTYKAIAKAKNYHTNCPITLIAGRDPLSGTVKNIYEGCTPLDWEHYKVGGNKKLPRPAVERIHPYDYTKNIEDNELAQNGLPAVAKQTESSHTTGRIWDVLTLYNPIWLAEQQCREAKVIFMEFTNRLTIEIQTGTVATTEISNGDKDAFRWEHGRTDIKLENASTMEMILPMVIQRIKTDCIKITSKEDIPWGLYMISIRFLALGREQWRTEETLSNMKLENPFLAGPPVVDPKRFFGQTAFIDTLLQLLAHSSIRLSGPRRCGKTSLLYRLRERCAEEWQVVFLDLHDYNLVSDEEFAREFYGEILDACNIPTSSAEPLVSRRGLQKKLNAAKIKRMLLLLDEGAVLAEHPRFSQQLRAMSKWDTPKTRIVVTGTRRDFELFTESTRTLGSAPFNEFTNKELDQLSKKNARDLLERPVLGYYRYEEKAVDTLLKFGAGRPFFLNMLARLTLNAARAEEGRLIRQTHVEAALEEAPHELHQWYLDFLRELPESVALPSLVKDNPVPVPEGDAEILRSAGLTVGPRGKLRLDPLFIKWYEVRERF